MPLFITNTSKTAYPVMGTTASNWAKNFMWLERRVKNISNLVDGDT